MAPALALFLWFVLLLALLRSDPARDSEVSSALWVPLTWMVFMASRLPSQWLGESSVSASAAGYEEGNLTDRTILSILIVLALGILMSRMIQWNDLFARNAALLLFLFVTFMSIVWSDFPITALKRWFRDLGNYIMILVVLTDPRPLQAIHTLLRRLCYLLIPLSVVLIKYYPQMGRGYSEWTGEAYYLGVTTSKNMLGALCLVSGIFLVWDTARRWSSRRERWTRQIMLVNVAFLGMTVWLLKIADSATSRGCFLIGCLVIALAHRRSVQHNTAWLKVLIPIALCLYMILDFGFNINDVVAEAFGRDPTFTGRSELWKDLLSLNTNPILGTGYESFWLGDRLAFLWAKHPFGPNQAHNGYLELYLNLGLLGLALVAAILISSYRHICQRLSLDPGAASLSLALWTVLLVYNTTEAAFKNHLLWFTFLLGAVVVPVRVAKAEPTRAADSLRLGVRQGTAR
jgi:O-antigen ligase